MYMYPLLKLIMLLIFILLGVAFVTLLERKILGYIQERKGPNKLLMKGLFQPFSDAIKLLLKESVVLNMANSIIYQLSPIAILLTSLLMWTTFPSVFGGLEISLPIIFILCCLSASVYPILGSGWASNSKYSMLGSLRAVAQTISYEVSLAIFILSLVVLALSFDLVKFYSLKLSTLLTLPPLMMLWFTSALAETNRTPFDFSEGESELVSGFNTEYMASGFVLFFLAEYSSILFMSLFFSVLFLNPLDTFLFLSVSTIALTFMFIWVRGTLPRLRYDKLMALAWKLFLPMAIAYLLFMTGLSLSALNFY